MNCPTLKEVFLSTENINLIKRCIVQELADRSVPMWTELEIQWGRGEIEKPIIVPVNFDDAQEQASILIEDYPFLFEHRLLTELNNKVIMTQVQSQLSGAKEFFFYQKALYRDHPIYAQRPIATREKRCDAEVLAPPTIQYSMYTPPGTDIEYWNGFRKLG
jgi:hypothetical protein